MVGGGGGGGKEGRKGVGLVEVVRKERGVAGGVVGIGGGVPRTAQGKSGLR